MKNTSRVVSEVRCNKTNVFLNLGRYWYKHSMPSGVLGELLTSSSMGKYYNAFIKGNFNEHRVDEKVLTRTRKLF